MAPVRALVAFLASAAMMAALLPAAAFALEPVEEIERADADLADALDDHAEVDAEDGDPLSDDDIVHALPSLHVASITIDGLPSSAHHEREGRVHLRGTKPPRAS